MLSVMHHALCHAPPPINHTCRLVFIHCSLYTYTVHHVHTQTHTPLYMCTCIHPHINNNKHYNNPYTLHNVHTCAQQTCTHIGHTLTQALRQRVFNTDLLTDTWLDTILLDPNHTPHTPNAPTTALPAAAAAAGGGANTIQGVALQGGTIGGGVGGISTAGGGGLPMGGTAVLTVFDLNDPGQFFEPNGPVSTQQGLGLDRAGALVLPLPPKVRGLCWGCVCVRSLSLSLSLSLCVCVCVCVFSLSPSTCVWGREGVCVSLYLCISFIV